MNEKKDRFDQKATWITRVTIGKPFEVRMNKQICILTAPDGHSIRSKLIPDNDHRELYNHANITVEEKSVFRHVNTLNTNIAGINIKLLKKGTCLEFRSDSSSAGHKNYSVLETELLSLGINIISETTERCEKDTCNMKL